MILVHQCCPHPIVSTLMYAERSLERLSEVNTIVLPIYTIRVTHEVRLIYRESNPWGSGANNKLHIYYHMFSPTIPMDLKRNCSVSDQKIYMIGCVNGKAFNPSLSSLGVR